MPYVRTESPLEAADCFDSAHGFGRIQLNRVFRRRVDEPSAAAENETAPEVDRIGIVQNVLRRINGFELCDDREEIVKRPFRRGQGDSRLREHLRVAEHHARREDERNPVDGAVPVAESAERGLEELPAVSVNFAEIRRKIQIFIAVLLHMQSGSEFEHPAFESGGKTQIRKFLFQQFRESGNPGTVRFKQNEI